MDEHRTTMAVEAAAKALHESVRRRHQLRWELMTETWRSEMRDYVRPSVLAALKVADTIGTVPRKPPLARRPAVPTRVR